MTDESKTGEPNVMLAGLFASEFEGESDHERAEDQEIELKELREQRHVGSDAEERFENRIEAEIFDEDVADIAVIDRFLEFEELVEGFRA